MESDRRAVIAIRTDASVSIGSGHVMRCLALADALQKIGAKVVFLCCPMPGDMCGRIRDKEFDVLQLDAAIADDAAACRVALAGGPMLDALVVDHYRIDANWESAMRSQAKRIVVIDDLADRPHDCDVLLDQNILDGEDPYAERVPAACQRLLGPRYALLRPQFAEARASLRRRNGSIRRVLINFGGSDPTGITESAIQCVMAAGIDGIEADIVLGGANPRAQELLARYGGRPRLNLVAHTDAMADMMAAADLAIGASGSSVWERCCVGLPGITIAVAENQRVLSHTLARRNIIDLVEDDEVGIPGGIIAALARLNNDPNRLREMSQRGLDLVDGFGANRVAGEICR